ncbi:MAG: hypothetical protein LBS91_05945 [Clostridiales Family XIII bacterium]|jgi:hypothetical protein|nr:hypothetical protein [Clostridiales Family XIII bacterium]
MGIFGKKKQAAAVDTSANAAPGAASAGRASAPAAASADAAPAPGVEVAESVAVTAADPAASPAGAVSGDELACVIAAAVAAYEAEQFIQTLYIRKIDRTAGVRPVWGVMGTQESIDTRRM